MNRDNGNGPKMTRETNNEIKQECVQLVSLGEHCLYVVLLVGPPRLFITAPVYRTEAQT